MMDDKDQEKVDNWLRGELSAKDESDLLSQAKADPELADELDFARDLDAVAGFTGRTELKGRLQGLEQRRNKTLRLRPIWRRPISIAAGILLLLACGAFWYANTAFSNDSLMAEFYERPNLSNIRAGDENTVWQQLTSAYYTGDFEEVVRLAEAEPDIGQTNDGIRLLAHTYLEMGRLEDADQQLQQMPEGPAKDWFRVLLFLKSDEQGALVSLLDEISATPDHPYEAEAFALRQKLKSGWRKLSW